MPPRNHVVITGTGRTGTTFLIELLTNLGLETGFRPAELSSKKSKNARAGLEHDMRSKDCPYIIKSPWFCDYACEVIDRDDIVIDHVFVPVRDLIAAAESRRFVSRNAFSGIPPISWIIWATRMRSIPGGLWHTGSVRPGDQEAVLLINFYKLMLTISGTAVPVTLMRYPRITMDCHYLFKKLAPILPAVNYETFCSEFRKTVRPELAHHFNARDC